MRTSILTGWAGSRAVSGGATHVFLVAFSRGMADSAVPASRIFDALAVERHVWAMPRCPAGLGAGSTLLFYESRAGARGYSIVKDLQALKPNDVALLAQLGVFHTKIKVALEPVHLFPAPVKLAPIVEMLDFVANKKHWGHSVRSTPRRISRRDFDLIVRASKGLR